MSAVLYESLQQGSSYGIHACIEPAMHHASSTVVQGWLFANNSFYKANYEAANTTLPPT